MAEQETPQKAEAYAILLVSWVLNASCHVCRLKAREEKLAKQADTYVEKKQRDAHAHVQHEMAKADKNAEKAIAKAAHKEANVSALSDSFGLCDCTLQHLVRTICHAKGKCLLFVL